MLKKLCISLFVFAVCCQPKNAVDDHPTISSQNVDTLLNLQEVVQNTSTNPEQTMLENFPKENDVSEAVNIPIADNYSISGPYTHNNLSIFLFHGEDKINTNKIITLDEALAQGKIKVYETGEVSKLAVENFSDDCAVYIHVGDIVKGGKQDRAIGKDLVVMPKSGKIAVNSFCVESGRWTNRGDELVAEFSSSEELANKSLKVALKYKKNQQDVWNSVSNIQDNLSSNLGTNVESTDSHTSMQLTLENNYVRSEKDKFIKSLEHIADENKDCLGFAYTVNGKVIQTDVYGSHGIFVKLWPKLLKAATIEAIQKKSEESFDIPTTQRVSGWIKEMRSGSVKKQKLSEFSTEYSYANEKSMGEDVWVDGDFLFGEGSEDNFMLHSSFSDISDESFTEKKEQILDYDCEYPPYDDEEIDYPE